MSVLINRIKARFASSGSFCLQVYRITGYWPKEEVLFRTALRHRSALQNGWQGNHQSHNERLEFLGDAVLNAAVADQLFALYPNRSEGFLTRVRSLLVSRKNLNQVAVELGIGELLHYVPAGFQKSQSIFGNALEALIGALFIDGGYKVAARFIAQRLLNDEGKLEVLVGSVVSYKSLLLEWAAKEKLSLRFAFLCSKGKSHNRLFEYSVVCVGRKYPSAWGKSKKEAAENAARMAHPLLKSRYHGL